MLPALLALLLAPLALLAENSVGGISQQTAPFPAGLDEAPATPTAPAKSALTPEEQKQLRNARAKANKQPQVAAALKAEDEAYRVAKDAKAAKKPKAEVDALYAKARELRAAREKLRDDAMLAANPALKPLIDKAAQPAAAPAKTDAAPAPAPEKKESEDGKDA